MKSNNLSDLSDKILLLDNKWFEENLSDSPGHLTNNLSDLSDQIVYCFIINGLKKTSPARPVIYTNSLSDLPDQAGYFNI